MPDPSADLITTAQAATDLGVSVRRVQVLITTGRLPAARLGRDYMIRAADLALVQDRKPGRAGWRSQATD